jgi:hypothetical protein
MTFPPVRPSANNANRYLATPSALAMIWIFTKNKSLDLLGYLSVFPENYQ